MNRKFLMFGLIGLFAITIVSAVAYYALFSVSFIVSSAISLDNETQDLGEVFSGGLIEGDLITILNDAPTERTITFEEETTCDIVTSYASKIDMNMKETVNWTILPNTTIVLSYVIVGDEFKYKVDEELVDYVLVYYPDLDGNPGAWNIANASLVGEANTEWTSSDIGYLPSDIDWNHAAKLWLIPLTDWNAQSWNPTEWYFENNLITYGEDVTIDAESSIEVIPLYEIGIGETGECTVTTTVA